MGGFISELQEVIGITNIKLKKVLLQSQAKYQII